MALTPKQRSDLIRRRGGDCDGCGKRVNAGNAQIHHKNRNPNDDRPSNLRLLCTPCHDKLHGK
jgi:5-methylcytosine-specific restriction endonuclease McrA